MKDSKFFALPFISAMLMGLLSCNTNSTSNTQRPLTLDFSLDEKISLSWLVGTQQSESLSNSPLVSAIEKKFNVKFTITEKSTADYQSYKNNKIASGNFPDIVSNLTSAEVKGYGSARFVELSQYLDYLPNYKEKVNIAINEDFNNYGYLFDMDGKMYGVNHYSYNPTPIWDFSYNKTKFAAAMKKANVSSLTTWDNIEKCLEVIKEENTNAYPIEFTKINNVGIKKPLQLFVESFTGGKATTMNHLAFDEAQGKFVLSLDVAGYKEAILYFNKLYSLGYVDPDYLNNDLETTINRLATTAAFGAGYVGGYVGNTNIYRNSLGDYEPLDIPISTGQNKTYGRMVTAFDEVSTGINIRKVGNDAKKLGRVLLILDYLYSDEFLELQWYNDDVTNKPTVGDRSTYTFKDIIFDRNSEINYKDIYYPWSFFANFQDLNNEILEDSNPYIEYKEKHLVKNAKQYYSSIPNVWFSSKNQDTISKAIARIEDIFGARLAAFVSGGYPFSDDDWNAFVSDVKSSGGTTIVKLYNDAYSAYVSKKNEVEGSK